MRLFAAGATRTYNTLSTALVLFTFHHGSISELHSHIILGGHISDREIDLLEKWVMRSHTERSRPCSDLIRVPRRHGT